MSVECVCWIVEANGFRVLQSSLFAPPKGSPQLGNNDFFMMCEYLMTSLCLLIQCLCSVLFFVPSFPPFAWIDIYVVCDFDAHKAARNESESTTCGEKKEAFSEVILKCGSDTPGPKGVHKSEFV